MVMRERLHEFTKGWLDPEDGKISQLSRHGWFADAKPEAKRIGARAIQSAVQGMVDYYEWADEVLA